MKPNRATPFSRRRMSRGVTLVELMVAVTIGLLLVVVISQLFLGSRQTFATTDDVSRMQDNIRFSQQLFARTIHLAGYKSQANSVTSTIFAGNPPLDAPLPLPTGTNPDAITIRYQGSGTKTSAANCQNFPPCAGADGSVVDCLGVRIDAGIIAVNTFTIAPDPGANNRPALFCNGVPIVADVQNMQILYGEDLNADLVADRYISPDTPGVNTANVVSVRVALLFQTPTESSKAAPDNQRYDMIGDCPGGVGACTVNLGPFNDRRIRRVVATTFNLRNRTP